ncbi:ABC transporter ATP-binding protein [Demequina aurantiaca]|uniref:ABC transporter ATP-binding protein n=1 Tax=Demequina aurantiaca TaxID=676200 RepID=UPI003D343E93
MSKRSVPRRSMRERAAEYWDAAFLARVRIWQIMPLAGWGRVAALIVIGLVLGALPIVFMLATSAMIGNVPDAVGGGEGSAAWNELVRLFLIAAVAFLLQQVLAPVQQLLGLSVQRTVDGRIRDQAVASVTSSVGISALEDGEVLGKFSEARMRFENNFHTPGHAVAGMLYLFARYVQLFALLVIIWIIFGALTAIAMTVAIATLRVGNRAGLRVYSALWRSNGHLRRRLVYLRDITMGSVAAKELRVFGSMAWMTKRHEDAFHEFADPVDRERRRIYFKPYLVYTAIALVTVTWALVSLVSRAAGTGAAPGELATGAMSLTALTLGLQALIGSLMLARDYPESDTSTQFGMNALTAIREVEDTVRDTDTAPRGTTDVPRHAPQSSIEFRGLHFAYPGTNQPVFSGLDLTIESGKTTAIVGINGAGKTTLMKLLARLYEPDAGGIYVDGVDIREFDLEQWRRTLSVVFQDFVHYEVSAADNVAFGAAFAPEDRDAVKAAAAATGMLDTLTDAPAGLETTLARAYKDGIDLSGGQWQRVAIARSLYALSKGARVLVLDEPTAALDVRAEAEFFDQFVELTEGVTTLLISHRFSSVRRADQIVVIEAGHVIERGTHGELLSADTHYKRLFDLQARRFHDGLDADDEADADAMGGAR